MPHFAAGPRLAFSVKVQVRARLAYDGEPVIGIRADQIAHPDFGSGTWDGAPIGIPYTTVSGTLPAGDYGSSCTFNSLVGCTLNGNWTIRVTDGGPRADWADPDPVPAPVTRATRPSTPPSTARSAPAPKSRCRIICDGS